MSERIDHYAQAQQTLKVLSETLAGMKGARPTITETVAIAQVQATLALVEQQRIANLQREREVDGVRFDRSGNASGTVAAEYMHIDGQIREALGLS